MFLFCFVVFFFNCCMRIAELLSNENENISFARVHLNENQRSANKQMKRRKSNEFQRIFAYFHRSGAKQTMRLLLNKHLKIYYYYVLFFEWNMANACVGEKWWIKDVERKGQNHKRWVWMRGRTRDSAQRRCIKWKEIKDYDLLTHSKHIPEFIYMYKFKPPPKGRQLYTHLTSV